MTVDVGFRLSILLIEYLTCNFFEIVKNICRFRCQWRLFLELFVFFSMLNGWSSARLPRGEPIFNKSPLHALRFCSTVGFHVQNPFSDMTTCPTCIKSDVRKPFSSKIKLRNFFLKTSLLFCHNQIDIFTLLLSPRLRHKIFAFFIKECFSLIFLHFFNLETIFVLIEWSLSYSWLISLFRMILAWGRLLDLPIIIWCSSSLCVPYSPIL